MTLYLVPTVAATPYIMHPPTKGSLESSYFWTSSMYLYYFITSVDSTEYLFCFWESRSPFVDINTLFQKGDSILILILYFNERSRTAQGETPLLPAVVGPHNIRHQHSLMLWWVLLCDYCSYFCHLLKTSELGRAINAHIIVTASYK